MDWTRSGILLSALIVALICAEVVRKRLNFSVKTTRKFIHVITGVFIAIAPFLLQSPYPLLIISGVFAILNLIAIKMDWMPGMHATERISYGTVFYPASFFILSLLLWNHYKSVLVTSMLIMAIADAMAAIVGEGAKKPIAYQISGELKSLQGSMAMFLSTFLISWLGMKFFVPIDGISIDLSHSLWIAGIVAIIAMACESISFKGSDNLTVPLGSAFVLHYMISHATVHNLYFTIGVLIALLIAGGSFFLHFLSGSGAVSTFLLGTIVFGIGKWEFSLPILLFFILSSLLSKMGKKWKSRFSATFQKGGQRDLGQVLANGGIAGVIMLLWNYFPNDVWYFVFVGSIAAVTADTWATEIGVFSRIAPRNILNFKQVPPGTSGGVTLLGLGAAILGSFIIVFFGSLVTSRYANLNQALPFFLIIIIAGLIGSIVDSVIGATVQAQYQCSICGKITEKKLHCQNTETKLISGYKLVDNDIVNAACAFSGALITWIAYHIFAS